MENFSLILIHQRIANLISIGSRDRKIISAIKTISSSFVNGEILKFLMTFVSITFSSSIANRCPMQFRGPREIFN